MSRSMPPASSLITERPVPAPPPTIGSPRAICSRTASGRHGGSCPRSRAGSPEAAPGLVLIAVDEERPPGSGRREDGQERHRAVGRVVDRVNLVLRDERDVPSPEPLFSPADPLLG